jgi:hypothetical protein
LALKIFNLLASNPTFNSLSGLSINLTL